ncbi:BZ3500_MvSof-1268-A1-R1_Chr7-1g09081 [Microbotryum saponariae]|uniref:BZ3500_MvSof-1268-A1-R1_Chr7-1g09081 protein n=1 Tax=Microbotryum saponariae TaxID=289078 RepID=A0A2X0MV70_9BASI|nr:BZ3501_MvSof-1269-A2-R1_Chr7-1g08785 [Microbotryum saponariae]SDA02761.1 BZ3500_MvSof-1268-A1-R1_Chr7-1g09081 [Microbotryum saponariae]
MSASHILYVGSYASTLSSLTLTVPYTSSAAAAASSLIVSNQLSPPSLGSGPSWLTQHGTTIYTADEDSHPYALHSCYSIDAQHPTILHFQASLKVPNQTGPVDLILSSDHAHLYAANYVSGSVSNIALDARTGSYLSGATPQSIVFTGAGPKLDRQTGPHAHQVALEPTGRYLLVCDLGSDQVRVFDTHTPSGDLNPLDSLSVAPGSGPRHLLFAGEGTLSDPTLVYLVNELSSTLLIARLDYPIEPSPHLTWTILQTISILPSTQPTLNWTGGELVLSPDRQHLFVSNRSPKQSPALKGHDLLSIFELDLATGKTTSTEPTFFPLPGLHPRHMSLSPEGDYLAVALQHSNKVVVYKRVGAQLESVGEVEVQKPTCVIWNTGGLEKVGKVVQSWVE